MNAREKEAAAKQTLYTDSEWSEGKDMLTEKRHEIILQLLRKKGSITVNEIKDELGISESTIRRDLNTLDEEGKLVKVFGGAVSVNYEFSGEEPTVSQKKDVNLDAKKAIAKYAAGLIEPDDFVYIDAGTTTGCMIDYIREKNATYVTNAVAHARNLAIAGFKVILIGGELKGSTEAVVGSSAVEALREYNFNKGFFGANGISIKSGITTPDISEAAVKRTAVEHSNYKYVLADSAKFDNVSSVTFARIDEVKFITDKNVADIYKDYDVKVVL